MFNAATAPHDGLCLLVIRELRRLLSVVGVPYPPQHLVGHDEVRARRHGGQESIEHSRVHGVGWGFLVREEVVEEVEFGVGEWRVHAWNFGTDGNRWI